MSIDPRPSSSSRPTAVVYCEGNFGRLDGKTANGLVRHSERYRIVSVIDSEQAGLDAGMVLDGVANGIPVRTDLAEAIAGRTPDAFIFGMAPSSGMLSGHERRVVLAAIGRGMDIVNGLHEFLNDDPELAAAAAESGVTIFDVRRPRAKKDLRMFSGRIAEVTCPRIAVLGTDGAIGKRTTATILTAALNARGTRAVLVGTGQTGLIQGARYGVALDAIPCQFCSGEMEASVVEAFEGEHPDVIIVEGQGALSHPAYLTSSFILRGSRPDAVILQHAPARKALGDFPSVPMPTAASEINLIETFADTKVIGLTINHEDMTDAEISAAIALYEAQLGIPATDPLTRPAERLVDMVLRAFPQLAGPEARHRYVSAPRLEIRLDRIGHNARSLVGRLGARGIAVTGITKATLGSPEVARELLGAGVSALGDSRIENIEHLRQSGVGGAGAKMVLIRSPMLSQADRVVAHADVSLNTEPVVIDALSRAAGRAGRTHGVVLMVELGDLREGILPADLEAVARRTIGLPNLTLAGIGTNLACQNGVAPDARNMAELSRMADSLESALGVALATVSGGNSANLDWALGSGAGRVNDLRLGEAILLGREPLRRRALEGLRTDAFTLVAEVIESKRKPSKAWGEINQTAFGSQPAPADRGERARSILAVGRADVDPDGLEAPAGTAVLGASSDHLVLDVGLVPSAIGDEVPFQLNYAALLAAMTSPHVAKVFLTGDGG